MTSLAAARRAPAFPLATVLIRGIALGVAGVLPPLVLIGPFALLFIAPVIVIGMAAGTGAAAAVALLLRLQHRFVVAAPRRGRLVIGVVAAAGSAVGILVMLFVWAWPEAPDWTSHGPSPLYWGGPVILGAGLIAMLTRGSLIRLLASNDTAGRRVRVARWAVVIGSLLIAVSLAMLSDLFVSGIAEELAGEADTTDYRATFVALVPGGTLLLAATFALHWRLPKEVELREEGNTFIALSGAVAATILVMVVLGTSR